MKIENIKFKAKRLDNGEWVKGDLVHSTSYVGISYPSDEFSDVPIVHRVAPETVCQFTGLTDCKGKELFEHDLIHIVGSNYAAEVIWSEGRYAFMVGCEDKHSYGLYSVLKVCKIERIGNKFDKEK